MYFQKILIQQVVAQTSFNDNTQTEVQVDRATPDGIIPPNTVTAFAGSTIAFVTIWAGFLLVMAKIRSLTEDNKVFFSVNSSHKVPCKSCRYFSHNHHLQCAVQPSIVLTEEATNCSDYCPKSVKFFNKNH